MPPKRSKIKLTEEDFQAMKVIPPSFYLFFRQQCFDAQEELIQSGVAPESLTTEEWKQYMQQYIINKYGYILWPVKIFLS